MLNKVTLIGRLGQEPETFTTNNGNAIVRLSLATTEKWKDKNSGESQEKTEWHRIVLFGRIAEVAQQYLNKGSLIYLEGKLQTSKYTDNNGVEKYSTEIIGSEMKMLGGRNDSQAEQQQPRQQQQQSRQQQPRQAQQQSRQSQPRHQQQRQQAQSFSDLDEDLPF